MAPSPAPSRPAAPVTSARAPASQIAFDAQRTVHLPCGRVVSVSPLDGECQTLLSPDREGKLDDPLGAISSVLARVVKRVDDRRIDPVHLAKQVVTWPSGSRLLAYLWARVLTYGARCAVPWTCPSCRHEHEAEVDLDELPVTPYDRTFLARGLVVDIRSRQGREYRFTVRAETGASQARFKAALGRREASPLQGPLSQAVLTHIDGAEVARGQGEDLASMLRATPADVIDHLLYLVRALEARRFASETHRAQWVAKANAYLLEHCRIEGLAVPAVGGGEASSELAPDVADQGEAPEASAGAAVGDFDVLGAADADEEPAALVVPQGGLATRLQTVCDHCGKPSWHGVDGALDFFFPHVKAAVED